MRALCVQHLVAGRGATKRPCWVRRRLHSRDCALSLLVSRSLRGSAWCDRQRIPFLTSTRPTPPPSSAFHSTLLSHSTGPAQPELPNHWEDGGVRERTEGTAIWRAAPGVAKPLGRRGRERENGRYSNLASLTGHLRSAVAEKLCTLANRHVGSAQLAIARAGERAPPMDTIRETRGRKKSFDGNMSVLTKLFVDLMRESACNRSHVLFRYACTREERG